MQDTDPRVTRTRQHAVQAALQIIADSGLQGCTIENVSERSGISRSTLYRHWNNKSELLIDALESQEIERVAPDTGNLRDDMLTAMLELGLALEHSTWGSMVAQLMAAVVVNPEVARIQKAASDYHLSIDSGIIKRAIKRGEISGKIDPEHAALLFTAPVFYCHLFNGKAPNARWITAHVDKTTTLISTL